MNKIGNIVFLIIFFFCWHLSHAQIYNSLNISRKDNLSNSNVTSICVDHLGYVWIGTKHGLNRYDGFETVTYYHDINNDSTLSDNIVNKIYEDREGRIWVLTPGGVNIFDRETESFQRVLSESAQIAYEDEKEIWIIHSDNTIYLYDKSVGTIKEDEIKLNAGEIPDRQYSFTKICDYSKKYLLLHAAGKGLYLLDKSHKELIPFFDLPINNSSGMFVLNGNIWISSYFDGIYKINRNNKRIEHYTLDNSELKNSIILDFRKHPLTNTLWVATDGGGIQELDESLNQLSHYQSGSGINQPLPDNAVQTIFFGEEGTIWAGTVRSGAVLLYPGNIEYFPYANNTSSGPSNKIILRGFEDKRKNIWLGTDGGGINRFNPSTYSFSWFPSDEADKITGIVPFSEDTILLSVYRKQLFFFDTKRLNYSDAHLHPLLDNVVRSVNYRLFKDSRSNIWISGSGLRKINVKENSKQLYPYSQYPELYSQFSPNFNCAYEDTVAGRLWFGARGGLYSYNYDKNSLEDFINLNKFRNRYGSEVYSVVTDKNSNVIFGTSKGLFKYDPEADLISDYFVHNRFDNTFFQVLFIADETLWAGTNNGLYKITSRESQKGIIKFDEGNFDYRPGAIIKSSDKKVYLGTNSGLLGLYPKLMRKDTVSRQPVITSFNLIGTEKGSNITTTLLHNISNEASLTIPFSNSVYRFNFNSFDFPYHDKISYSYLLEGFEEIWHTGKARSATYTNLNPGKYVFHLKASTKSGVWDDKRTKIEFEVLPPWWQTAWFRIVIVVLLILTATLIWMESLKRAKLKYLLEVEKNEQKRLKEVNQMKLRFFTNISHELRTPLTLIYTPLKRMANENVSLTEIKKGLPGLYRNVNRMKDLVDQILEFRKAEMDELCLEVKKCDIVELCRETLDSFSYMAQAEGIELSLKHEDKALYFHFDRDKFSKILFNLFSNAVKYTSRGGRITVVLENNDESVYLRVSDTGKGIPESKLGNIFDRYYQVEPNIAGSGIGLALTKKLVDLHRGEIWVDSKVGKGTTFTVKVPFKHDNVNTYGKEVPSEPVIHYKEIQKDEQHTQRNVNGSVSLLIIEDDWELRNYLAEEFRNNFKIYTASNGCIGLDKAIKNLPDIIISDVMMPELDGFGLCKALRDDLRISHIPVILLTAKTMSEDMVTGYKSGADLYVSKPFDKDILLSQIESLLNNRELLKKRFSHDLDIKVEDVTHSENDEKLLHKAISIIEMNMQNAQFDVNSFVEQLGISRTMAYKKIKAISGKSINDFILSVRLQKAGKLLMKTDKTIAEVAYEVGFSDHSYFSAVFKKQFNTSPTSFRKTPVNS